MPSDNEELSQLAKIQADRRETLRRYFLREKSNPFTHMKGDGGTLFDPAVMRFEAMKNYQREYFKPSPRTVTGGLGFLSVLVATWFLVYKTKNDKEAKYRRGEVAYECRKVKMS
ncbi:unnamed protein product [Phyllotreta striolata]|uniref:NADH dehydrogenase [ubiquinone] 1 beta subcomplex subunit 4 n=1 Tax=Phyllotreta striolata TaxID=444603 RepID=A0A9N9TLS5_PHYSR|nr:unnamed protein product [Phyllotreta striolata]